jgi:hypothetical protein
MAICLQFEFEPQMEAVTGITRALVASHVHIVFSIPKHHYYMYTGTPSKPILAEAVREFMFILENHRIFIKIPLLIYLL